MREKLAAGGSLLASIAASLCCLGPLLAAAVGAGAFGAATAFETARPYLLALTGLLLAAAFYLVYRKQEAQCEDETCKVSSSRASKAMLWMATIWVIAFAAFPYYSGALLKARAERNDLAAASSAMPQSAISNESTAIIAVRGMTCDSCAVQVQSALEKTRGVKSADVSYEQCRAVVVFDPNAASEDSIRGVVTATGYEPGEVAAAAPEQENFATVKFKVEGMYCGACAATLRIAVEKIKGVASADVSLDKKEADIIFNPALVGTENIKAAIEAAGFKATQAISKG